ncbi:MAG TPA: serine hydrolase domain-containing protein [Candidatus Binataceae bacterium]|nr:serine hydrolase domain-containing protein [Candidatus Binataceae bacterium]
MPNLTINGEYDPRFVRVRDAFIENFEQRGEFGAAASIVVDGRCVVDLWAGHADAARTQPWNRDTLVNVWSTTKGLCAMCAHRLADQGKLDFDAPVAKYWPEFAQSGKGSIPVSYLLNHKAGLAAIKAPLQNEDLFNWEKVTTELARQEPWWEPGTRHGYHAITFGWLVGEVVRRISGKSLGAYFREEIATPLGADAHIGIGPEFDARVTDIIYAPDPKPGEVNLLADMMNDPASVGAMALANPANIFLQETTNSRAWRAAEIPGANGHANARALARIYGALARGGEVNGVRVFGPKEIERCYTEQSNGQDAVLPLTTRFSLGFMLSQPHSKMGPNPRAFGHPGAGGSLGFADPDAKLGFGYTMNQMGLDPLLDARPAALIAAAYASL